MASLLPGIEQYSPAFSRTNAQPYQSRGQLGRDAAMIAQGFRNMEAQKAMQEAIESGDPNNMADVAAQYPEISEVIRQRMGFTNAQTEQQVRDTYRRIINDPERAKEYLSSGIKAVLEAGGQPNNMARDLQMFSDNPEAALQTIKMAYAGYDPQFQKESREYRDTVQKSDILPDGTTIQVLKSGVTRVVGPDGEVLKGSDRSEALRKAREAGFEEQKGRAGARTAGAEISKRKQGFIDSGVDAIDSIGGIKRAIDLLDVVQTGGWDSTVALEAKRAFGIESADEGELANRLGEAVLARLKPLFGAAFTAAEGERLEKLSAGFGKNPETNKRILQDQMKTAERATRRAYNAAKDEGDQFVMSEMERLANELGIDIGQPKKETQGGSDGLTPEEQAELEQLRIELGM